ncbi:MAG: ATP-binding protein [Bacteroidota bacterium]
MSLKEIWYTLSNLGIDSYTSEHDSRLIRLLNMAAISVLPVPISVSLLSFSFGFPIGGISSLITLLILSVILFANWKGYVEFARWWTVLAFTIFVSYSVIAFGRDLGASSCFVVLALVIATFFRAKWKRAMGFGLIILATFFTEYFLRNEGPLLENQIFPYGSAFIILANILATLAVISFFFSGIESYEEEQKKLLMDLKASHDELVEKNQQIEKQNQELSLLNGELERFTYAASHHFKTPLRNIHSFMGLLDAKLKSEDKEAVQSFIDFARNSSLRMYQLVQDLLSYSRIDKEEYEIGRVSLAEIIKGIEEDLMTEMSVNPYRLEVGELPDIEGYHFHFKLLLQNLIENGLKYNESQETIVRITSQQKKGVLLIHIEDNGIGIEEEYLSKVFQMFERLHTQDTYEGTGIGLTLCKKIAQIYGGDISLKSVPGKGSVFTLSFPATIISPELPQALDTDRLVETNN